MKKSTDATTKLVLLRKGSLLKSSPEVPDSLLGSAARRLSGAALIASLGFLLFLTIDVTSRGVAGPPQTEDIVLNSISAALSLVLFFLARLPRMRVEVLMDIGLVYEVIIALLISLAECISEWVPGESVWGISWVCLVIVVFPILVPHRKFPSIVAGTLAAATGPIAYLATAPMQNKPVLVSDLIDLFSPNVIALVLSIALIFFMHKIGRELSRARELGSYRLVERIGAGSMGEVWKAEHTWMARPAAIKIISPDRIVADDGMSEAQSRFRREAEATASMASPHTVTLYDYGITDSGFPYYVMELLDGIDLQSFVERFGPMPPERAAFVARQICLSLIEAHEANLVHRDIKPANVYLCRKGMQTDFVTVLDFGLVKPMGKEARELTLESVVAGTPAYMAPEVARGKVYTNLSDIYSLGCLCYALASGRQVFAGNSPLEVISAHMNTAPEPPSLSGKDPRNSLFVSLVMDCLEKDPARRPPDCRSILERLETLRWAEPWTWNRAREWWETNL